MCISWKMTVLVKQNEQCIQQSTWQSILKPQRLLEFFKIKIHNTESVQSMTHRDRAWVDFAIHKMLRTVQMEKCPRLGP